MVPVGGLIAQSNQYSFIDHIIHYYIRDPISSTTPPLPRIVFILMPMSVPSKTQFEMAILFTPPLISLPITTPPCPLSIVQFVIVTFSVGYWLPFRLHHVPI